jgi:exodeoxyribonuclease VIII
VIEREDRCNWSSLKHMLVSPRHYRYALLNPREDTEALLLGRLTHALIYEPDAVASRYVREPRFNRAMKDDTARERGYEGGKDAAAAWTVANAGRDIVPVELWDRAVGMAVAVQTDPIAGPMVRGGFAEQLVTWTDPVTGIECRGRVDHVNGRLSDLKTARSVEPRMFGAQAARLGYVGQLAYYADGLAANGIALMEPPALVVVENVAPHDVVVLEFDEATLEAGRRLYRSCLDRLAECRATDDWPGVSGGKRQTLVLPAWAAAVEDEALTLGGEAIAF